VIVDSMEFLRLLFKRIRSEIWSQDQVYK